MNPVHIFGGGLAGLTLGIALRQAEVPVTITEATRYPRHRVCGEFISGAGQRILESFGLNDVLSGSVSNLETAWFAEGKFLFSAPLPSPARGLSRFELDQRLAARFSALGGELVSGAGTRPLPAGPGTVWACGRRGTTRNWIGLKVHYRGFQQEHDLTMHLGSHGYLGISRVESDRVNACGLFRTRRDISPGKNDMLPAYLRANGLNRLADQLAAAEIDPGSATATTSLNFQNNEWPPETICIGDCHTAIPPFAGNGMSMAFESARIAFPHLLAYARGKECWLDVRSALQLALHRRFRLRLATGRLLHPLLLQSRGRRPLTWALSRRVLPFHLIYRLLR